MKKGRKQQLSRERIIEVGLKLADDAGVSAVTFRKLAAELGVTAMAMYRHFDSKEELLAEMLDQFIRNAQVLPTEPLPWQQWLHQVANRMFTVLREEPSWIPVFGTVQLRPAALQVMNQCLAVLQDAGFSRVQSVEAFLAMIHTMLGGSLMYASLQVEVSLSDLASLSRYPVVEQSLPELMNIESADLPGLSLLISGLEQQLKTEG